MKRSVFLFVLLSALVLTGCVRAAPPAVRTLSLEAPVVEFDDGYREFPRLDLSKAGGELSYLGSEDADGGRVDSYRDAFGNLFGFDEKGRIVNFEGNGEDVHAIDMNEYQSDDASTEQLLNNACAVLGTVFGVDANGLELMDISVSGTGETGFTLTERCGFCAGPVFYAAVQPNGIVSAFRAVGIYELGGVDMKKLAAVKQTEVDEFAALSAMEEFFGSYKECVGFEYYLVKRGGGYYIDVRTDVRLEDGVTTADYYYKLK